MRRTSKRYGRRHTTPRHLANRGTVKSIERQRGTGSIGPDRGSTVNADTGFTDRDVVRDSFGTLQVGDRVEFNATLDPKRPGYADATAVDVESAPSAAEQAVKNQEAALASGEENPGA